MHYFLLFQRERVKYGVVNFFKKIVGRLQTPMDMLVAYLKNIGYWNDSMEALEMFGMFGLWHTRDYIDDVKSLDFFEINSSYIPFAHKALKKWNVDFFCEDSIEYIKNTKKKYGLVVADIPIAGEFYDDKGLPYFIDDVIRVMDERGIAIVNIHTRFLKNKSDILEAVKQLTDREIKDIFLFPRNEVLTYLILVLNS